ncbi:MAG: preprotein translocase subunit SecE [Candidatus Hydrogenedentes bacterium]|nr:preprotein translocase subunit SecE [Candidatus Hydrogenedentota bacterium]
MAKQITVEKRPGIIARIQTFFEDIVNELKKVTWPTREDLVASTKVTLFLLLVMASIIFVYDRVFGFLIMQILSFAS